MRNGEGYFSLSQAAIAELKTQASKIAYGVAKGHKHKRWLEVVQAIEKILWEVVPEGSIWDDQSDD